MKSKKTSKLDKQVKNDLRLRNYAIKNGVTIVLALKNCTTTYYPDGSSVSTL